MNRRKFFRAAASFVAGCALGLGLRPKMDAVEKVIESPDYEFVVVLEKLKLIEDDNRILYFSKDGVRSLTYKSVDGKWIKDESTRKA